MTFHGPRTSTVATLGALLALAALVTALEAPQPAQARAKYRISQQTFQLATNHPVRYQVYCPRGYDPTGGGMFADPPVAANGAGAYPTSSERLGAQAGWHVTAVRRGSRQTYNVTLQVFCRRPMKQDFNPVEIKFAIPPGQSASQVVSCPKHRRLISGGYLASTLFAQDSGYATESRRFSARSWLVSGYAVPDGGGGKIIAIAYCLDAKRPLISELSGSGVTGSGALGSIAAPSCPGNQPLAVGGFAESPSGGLRFYDTAADVNGDWSVSAAGFLGGGGFTAYSYCLTGPNSALAPA